MSLDWTTAVIAAVMSLGATRPARAQEIDTSRPVILAFDAGVCIPESGRFFSGHVTSPLAAGYLGVDLHVDLGTYVGLGAFGAIAPVFDGFVGGGSARFTQPWGSHAARVTAGLGPAYGSNGSILAVGDVSLEVRSQIGFALVMGPALGMTLNRVGDGRCGVDTCDTYIPPGSYVVLFRLGLGFNL